MMLLTVYNKPGSRNCRQSVVVFESLRSSDAFDRSPVELGVRPVWNEHEPTDDPVDGQAAIGHRVVRFDRRMEPRRRVDDVIAVSPEYDNDRHPWWNRSVSAAVDDRGTTDTARRRRNVADRLAENDVGTIWNARLVTGRRRYGGNEYLVNDSCEICDNIVV